MSDAVNTEQAAYWTDVAGPHWVTQQQLFDQMLTHFGAAALSVFGASPGERVLDIGCGTGTSSIALAEAVGTSGSVVGFDISPTMIEAARVRCATLQQLSFVVGDAQVDSPTSSDQLFDGAFSRFGVMFFDDPAAAFTTIATSIRPGGRLTFACWQAEEANDWVAVPAGIMRTFTPNPISLSDGAPGPFAFHDPARIRAILQGAGWLDVDVQPCTAPTVMGAGQGVEAALVQTMGTSVGQILRSQVDDETFAAATAAVRDALSAHIVDGAVTFEGNVWIASARRP